MFADHNLVTDGVFGEMHLIFCRNVLIYFNKELQNRVIGLFRDSLVLAVFSVSAPRKVCSSPSMPRHSSRSSNPSGSIANDFCTNDGTECAALYCTSIPASKYLPTPYS